MSHKSARRNPLGRSQGSVQGRHKNRRIGSFTFAVSKAADLCCELIGRQAKEPFFEPR
jgi:hypothetical protein